ncbi:hypothetical protein DFH09DRAFT_1221875 [Mycena vulgaris]|nr:hypothetical protein DFH09DRAFT_1221875 [Mycena vulgaris]
MRTEYSRRDCDANAGPLLAAARHVDALPVAGICGHWLPRSSSRSGGHLAPVLSEGTRAVTSPCPHVHRLRLRASTPPHKPSPEVGLYPTASTLAFDVPSTLRCARFFESKCPSPPIRARCRDRTAPLRMRSADVMCVLMRRGDELGRSRRSEVLRGMRSLGLRVGGDGRGAGVAHERHGWGFGDAGIREDDGDPGIPRCFALARLPHEPHFLEAHDIIADKDHLATRRAHLFRSRRPRHERHVLLKRLLIADSPIAPGHFDGFTHPRRPRGARRRQQEPPCPLLALDSALDPRTASRVAANNEGGTTSPLARARGPSEIGSPHWICDRGEFHGGGPSRLIESYGSPYERISRLSG